MKKFLEKIKNIFFLIRNYYFNLSTSWKKLLFIIFLISFSSFANNLFFSNIDNDRIYKNKYNDFMVLKEKNDKDFLIKNKEIIETTVIDREKNNIQGEIKKNLKLSNKNKINYIDSKYNYILDDLSLDYYFGNDFAPINVIVYSSFNCPHCLDFHKNVFEKLKKNYIDTNLIKYVSRIFIHKNTLSAVMLPYCAKTENQLNIMNELYNQITYWITSFIKYCSK